MLTLYGDCSGPSKNMFHLYMFDSSTNWIFIPVGGSCVHCASSFVTIELVMSRFRSTNSLLGVFADLELTHLRDTLLSAGRPHDENLKTLDLLNLCERRNGDAGYIIALRQEPAGRIIEGAEASAISGIERSSTGGSS